MKIRLRAELFVVRGRTETDTTKLTVAFRHYVNVPRKSVSTSQ